MKTLKEKLKQAYLDIGNGRPFVMIHEIRERLNMDRQTFDATLKSLARSGEIELTGGDPSSMTDQQIKDSYIDDLGHDLYSICWWGDHN